LTLAALFAVVILSTTATALVALTTLAAAFTLSTLTVTTAALIALALPTLASSSALSAATATLAALPTLAAPLALSTRFAFAKGFAHFDGAIEVSSSIKLLEGAHYITRAFVASRMLNQLFSVGWIVDAA